MFKEWDSFYLMLGSSAGALIGLLFVVATLGGNLAHDQAEPGQRTYMTPLVFHLAIVLVLSCVTAVPGLRDRAGGLIVGGAGVLGLAYAIWIMCRLRSRKLPTPPHWSDFWFYGFGPAAIYLALIASAIMVATSQPAAADLVALFLTALLMTTIRNAWDLVTWLAPVAVGKDPPG
jgi:hypothetical protein